MRKWSNNSSNTSWSWIFTKRPFSHLPEGYENGSLTRCWSTLNETWNINRLKLSSFNSVQDIYGEFLRTIKQTNPERDLVNWSKENGAGMGMNWPIFEV